MKLRDDEEKSHNCITSYGVRLWRLNSKLTFVLRYRLLLQLLMYVHMYKHMCKCDQLVSPNEKSGREVDERGLVTWIPFEPD